MNRNLCSGCKRFQAGEDDEQWFCASEVEERYSKVVPGFIIYEKNFLHQIQKTRKLPPEWCEYIIEQTVVTEEDVIEEKKNVKGYFK